MSNLQKFVQKSFHSLGPVEDTASLHGIVRECTRSECLNSFGDKLKAIVLTGSMAREEASFVREDDFWKLFSDAEFMVVLEENAAVPAVTALCEIRRRIESSLLQQNIQCKIDLSAVHPSYFRHLPAHIFTYELKHCGRVIAGDERILQSIPDYPADSLSLEDAWRLLCNRLLEVLECAAELSNNRNSSSAEVQYKILKLYLDMTTSLLVFLRGYAPTYQERSGILRHLADLSTQPGEYPFELRSFADRVARCTERKLSSQGSNQCVLDFPWRDVLDTAHELWRWELHRLTGSSTVLSDSELMDEMIRLQPFTARVRGWMYVLRARGWHRSYRHWPRWLRLGCRTSPRYCVYAAACSLLFNPDFDSAPRPPGQKENRGWNIPSSWLPVMDHARVDGNKLDWLKTASAAVSNYREFVVGTRA